MTSDKRLKDENVKDKNEWQKFLETGKGGQDAVPNAKQSINRFGKIRRVSMKQRNALRRGNNG